MNCTHLDQVKPEVGPRTPDGCEECLQIGDRWVELRMCETCGHVGCCDSTPGRHATQHFRETGHAVMRAYRAPADWEWCYVDRVYVDRRAA